MKTKIGIGFVIAIILIIGGIFIWKNYVVSGSFYQPGEGLSREEIERLDAAPESSLTEDQIILPNGQSLSSYAKSRGITLPHNSTTSDNSYVNSPEDTLKGYAAALANDNIEGALKYVSKSAQEKQKSAFNDVVNKKDLKLLADAILSSTKEYEDDSAIKYKAVMKLPDGSEVEDTFWLVLENGEWKVTGL